MPVLSAFMAPLWKYLSAGLLAVCLILGIALHFERRSLAKANQRIVELSAKLAEISSKTSEQRTVTKTNIVHVTKLVHDADSKAKVVEQAKLPGSCRTPPEIIGADL